MGDGPLREPSPIRQGIKRRAVKDKIGTLKGTPDFFLDGLAAVRQLNKFTKCKY